jgi:CheY-like chemotaxis protein
MSRATTAAQRTKRILVVDDSEVIQEVLREFFRQDYTVDTVGNAASALTAVVEHKPNAILIDVRMPGLDGLTLLEKLRDLGVQTPIFMMTGYDSKEVALEAMKRGANGYLPKPFDLLHLEQVLAETIS